MIPKRVVLENFLSFASPAVVFDFTGDDEALWVITGPNGCGKSAVFDGITFALFECHRGSDIRQKQDLLMRHGADSYHVVLEFDFAGHSYRITRGRSRSGKTTRPLQKLEEQSANGDWIALKEGTSGDTLNKWVVETLGLNYDSFTSSVLLKQGEADKLLSSSKENSLKILKGIIGFEHYEALSARVKTATSVVRSTVSSLKTRFATLSVVSPEDLAASQTRADRADALRREASALHATAIERVGQSRTWQKCHARFDELGEMLSQADHRASRATTIRHQKLRVDELDTVVPLLQSLLDGKRELATWQVALDDRERLRNEATNRRDSSRIASAEARGQVAEHTAASESIERELSEIVRNIRSVRSFHTQAVELDKLAGEVSRYPVDLPARLTVATEEETTADGEFRRVENQLTEARTHLKSAQAEQAEFQDVKAGIDCSRCGQKVTAEHAQTERARMANDVALWQTRTTERQAIVSVAQEKWTKAKADLAGFVKQSTERNRFHDKFQTLQSSLTGMGCTSNTAELIAEQQALETNEKLMRERFTLAQKEKTATEAIAVQQETIGKSAEAELKQLESQVAEATEKRASLQGAQTSHAARLSSPWDAQWPTLSAYEVQVLVQELAELRMTSVESDYRQLLNDEAKRSVWRDEQDRVQTEIDGIEPADRILPDVAEATRTQAAKQLATADADHRESLRDHENRMKQSSEYQQVSTGLAEAQARLVVHETLDKSLGDKGIQLDLVREAETEVIALADDTLRRLSNQDLSLEVDDEATGRDLKAFALRIRKVGENPVGVDFISGSQRFRVAVSLALAIGRFAAGKQRPIEAVIIDEGFGSLDKDGLRAMAENLHELRRTQALKRIILVSHQETFTDQFATGYRLTPSESGTTAERM